MIPLETLRKAGYSESELRKKLTATAKDPKVGDFIDMVDSRCREGIEHCLANCQTWSAIDELMSRPLQQLNTVIARHLVDCRESLGSDLQSIASNLGLGSMLTQAFDPRTGQAMLDKSGKPVMGLDLPVFQDIFVPLALAYTKARWATAFNDIDTQPLYKFSPLIPSDQEKLRCAIIEGMIERQNSQMGYRADERQLILQQLTYGHAVSFPREPWYTESVGIGDDKRIVKAGIRSDIPHPSRCYIDMASRPSTINSDTGTCFGMHWDLYRWRDVRADSKMWIDDRENYQLSRGNGVFPFSGAGWSIYQNLFPCQAKFPTGVYGAGQRMDNRQDEAFAYTTSHLDSGVAVCKSFHKIIPKEFGLFDYDEPLWMGVKTAFTRDILHAEPYPYRPLAGYFYDRDDNRAIGSSIPIEVAPFEAQIGNLLTQFVITIRRNLQNFVFFNSDGLPETEVERIKSSGAGGRAYTNINFVPISFSRLGDRQIDPRSLIMPIVMPLAPTAETLQGIRMTLDIVDRLIGFSPAEAGTVTPHEITATEDTTIRDQVTARRRFTLGFSEDGMRARQNMLYDATMTYGEDEVFVEIAIDKLEIDPETARKILGELGFEIGAQWNRGGSLGVTGSKTKLEVYGFASGRTGINRVNDVDLAKQFLQIFQSIFSNQAIAESVGIETMLGWFNNIAIYAGLPSSMRLRLKDPQAGGPGQMQQLMAAVPQMIAQMGEQQLQALQQAIQGKLLQPMQEEIGRAITEVVRRVSRLEGAVGIPPQANAAPSQGAPPNEGNPV